MAFWHRLIVVAVVVAVSALVAKLVDLRISRRKLAPGIETRYRILRRTLMAGIVFVGLLSALLVSGLEGTATITVRAWAPNEAAADRLEADLRLRLHGALREHGVWHPRGA